MAGNWPASWIGRRRRVGLGPPAEVSYSSRKVRRVVALESVLDSGPPPVRPRQELVVRLGGVCTLWRRCRSVTVVVGTAIAGCRIVLKVADLASSELMARWWPSAATRPYPPRSTGIGGDCRCGRPYGGGADPGSGVDAGLFLPRLVHGEVGCWRCLVA